MPIVNVACEHSLAAAGISARRKIGTSEELTEPSAPVQKLSAAACRAIAAGFQACKQARLIVCALAPSLGHSVTPLLVLPRVDIAVERPNAATTLLGILQRFDISFVGTIAFQNLGPSIQHHLEFHISRQAQIPRTFGCGRILVGDGKIGNGNDPAMPVDNAARVHLR